ncbi:MAG: DUF1566 domain-containing protein [Alphaproteobacteria bacterium]|nr:DUF1566 domain-containing protein [Alphaproteobacteria bacterium]
MGDYCGNLASGSDFDTLIQCTSSIAGSNGRMQTAPYILGTVTAPPYGAITCDEGKAGMLQWTGTNFQACDGTTWTVFAGATAASANPFSFTNQTGVSFNKTIISNAVPLAGFSGQVFASCNTGCTGIYRNGSFIGMSGYFWPGDTIGIQLTSALTGLTATTATVTVGTTTSGVWTVTTGPAADACAGTPPAGTVCADGTIYVGVSPDGFTNRMYAAPCDIGMSWDGLFCTGGRANQSWNNGTTPDTILTGFNSVTTGRANTAGLAALNNASSPYQAAVACQNLTVVGHSDWYLPARDELIMVHAISQNGTANGFTTTNYWSSSETNAGSASHIQPSTGNVVADNKSYSRAIRCVRR